MRFFNSMFEQFNRAPLSFAVAWLIVFAALFVAFFQHGWVPPVFRVNDTGSVTGNTPLVEAVETRDAALPASSGSEDAPVRVVAEDVDLDVLIRNPETRDIDVLNQELAYGAVHYPGSGNLEDVSNMFIFGHSTNWPIVENQSYKAFNGLDDLSVGDIVTVYSETHRYRYRVTTVSLVDAREAWVQFDSNRKKLTLSTCNTFGEVQDRYVVEADFVGKEVL